MDNSLVEIKGSTPFNFEIENKMTTGNHLIKVVAIDDKNSTAESNITIKITGSKPTVDKIEIINNKSNEIEIKSKILSDGGEIIIEKGFCWNTSGNPSINKIDIGSGLGEFEGIIENLDLGKNIITVHLLQI